MPKVNFLPLKALILTVILKYRRMKKFLLLLLIIGLAACATEPKELKHYSGEALGTFYDVKFFSDDEFAVERGIDSVFKVVNKSMSNYQDDSDIAKINSGDTSITVDHMFREVFLLSESIYDKTDGYFDPTVGNVVNAYGFGAENQELKMDSTTIDSLMKDVGLDKVSISEDNKIIKDRPNIYLDFNGIAKGYAVDRLGLYLEEQGVTDYLVDVGGEIRAKGKNLKSEKNWRLGIDDPRLESETQHELTGIMELKNKSMATSGNYRKFREDSVTGEKYVHIIDPKSGHTQKRRILSTSVLAEDCASADAYATAFMAMGIEKAEAIAKELDGVDVYFIYDDEGELGTYISEGFKEAMVEE